MRQQLEYKNASKFFALRLKGGMLLPLLTFGLGGARAATLD